MIKIYDKTNKIWKKINSLKVYINKGWRSCRGLIYDNNERKWKQIFPPSEDPTTTSATFISGSDFNRILMSLEEETSATFISGSDFNNILRGM